MDSIIVNLANKSSTDLSDKSFLFAKYDTSGVNVCNGIADKVAGVFTKGGETTSDVCVLGRCGVRLGGTVAAGQHVQPHTDSTAVVSAGSSSQDAAIAIEGGVAGDVVQCVLLGVANKY